MICQRCGYCCIAFDVIVPIPSKKKNVVIGAYKPANALCWHLSFDEEGNAVCAIHNDPIYKKCPCHDYDQIGGKNDVCRTGNWMLTEGREILLEKKKLPTAIPKPIEISI